MWEEKNDKLIKTFEFENFNEALAFVNGVGDLAEKENHHPDILIHDYKFVTVSLTTHSEGKVTQKDHSLAKKISTLLSGKDPS